MTTILASFHDSVDNMTAMVFQSSQAAGGFGVSLRDDDSGEMVGVSFHGFQTFEAAITKAQSII